MTANNALLTDCEKGFFEKNEFLGIGSSIGQAGHCKLQWKLLNVITLGQRETDNINQMITISGSLTHLN